MAKKFGKDLTQGSIGKNLVGLSIPIFLSYLLVSSYSIVDALWIGNLFGEDGLAAIAISFPLSMFMTVFFNSMSSSVATLIAHSFGAKDHEGIKKIVSTAYLFILMVSLVVAAAGALGSSFIIRVFRTPGEISDSATQYLMLTFISFLFFGLYTLVLSIFRSMGYAKLPMLVTFIGVLINIILDPVLMMGLGPFPKLELMGAIVATIVCNAVILVLSFVYLRIKYFTSPIYPRKLRADGAIIRNILKIGLPSFLQQTLIYVGTALMTIFVNDFGVKAAAAYGTTSRIDAFAILPAGAVLFAVMTMTAQHMGSNKSDKIKDILKWGLLINTPIILIISLAIIFFPDIVMGAFIEDAETIRIGELYLRLAGVGYLLYIPNFVANGIVTGAKRAQVSLVISFVMILVIRVPLAAILIYAAEFSALMGVVTATVISLCLGTGALVFYVLRRKW